MDTLFSYREEGLYCHCSLDEAPDPDSFPIHAHEMLEIYCFLSGKGTYLVEGTRYPLEAGDIFLMRPAETHKLLIEASEPYRRIAAHVCPAFFTQIDPEQRLLRPFFARPLGSMNRYPAAQYPELHRVFDGFVLTPGLERIQILSRVMLLLSQIAALYPSISGHTPVPCGFAFSLVSYVNAHLFEPISLDAISRSFARSPSQIGRVFRAATGTSLWEYVLLKRLLSARAMLERGETATDAALLCGFSDYSAFYRAYRKHFGRTPSDDKPSM